jgi:hypothetical protein
MDSIGIPECPPARPPNRSADRKTSRQRYPRRASPPMCPDLGFRYTQPAEQSTLCAHVNAQPPLRLRALLVMTSIMASSLDTPRVLFLFCLAPLPSYLELLRFFCLFGRPTLINNAGLGASTRFFADFPDRRTGCPCHGNRTGPPQSAVCAFIRIAWSVLGIDSIGVDVSVLGLWRRGVTVCCFARI